MEIVQDTVRFIVLICFSVLGWLLGRSYHKTTSSDELIHVPGVFTFLLGHTDSNDLYNIRGIYLQVFVIVFTIVFSLYILDIISLLALSRVLLTFLIRVFPLFEVIRVILRKKNKT
jgi:hypothetical protein